MRRAKVIVGIVLLIGVIGASWIYFRGRREGGFDRSKNVLPAEVVKVLNEGEKFVLLSLDPTHVQFRTMKGDSVGETFHDYQVLGKVEIRDAKERAELLRALYKGIAESDGSVAMCFNPRHGISAVMGGETVELVICFECQSMETHTAKGRGEGVLTTGSPQEAFDKVLEKTGIRRSGKEEAKKGDAGFE